MRPLHHNKKSETVQLAGKASACLTTLAGQLALTLSGNLGQAHLQLSLLCGAPEIESAPLSCVHIRRFVCEEGTTRFWAAVILALPHCEGDSWATNAQGRDLCGFCKGNSMIQKMDTVVAYSALVLNLRRRSQWLTEQATVKKISWIAWDKWVLCYLLATWIPAVLLMIHKSSRRGSFITSV